MVVDSLAAESMIILVRELGFPIAAFIIAISVVIYMIKKDEARQKTSDIRYDKLVDQFVETTKKISEDRKLFVDTISKEIRDMTVSVSVMTVKIDNLSNSIEEKLEAKSPLFVFKDKKEIDKYMERTKR